MRAGDVDGLSARSTLQRGFAILQALVDGPSVMRQSQIADRVSLPKATVHRFVGELVALGALQRAEGGGYSLGPLLSVLGDQVPLYTKVRDTALPYLQELYLRTSSKIVLGTLQGAEIYTLAKVADFSSVAPRAFSGRVPAHCTAVGKAILAFGEESWLETVLDHRMRRYTPYTIVDSARYKRELAVSRARGYAVNDQESRLGTHAVAVPLIGESGRPIAALAVAARVHRDEKRVAQLCKAVSESLVKELTSRCPGIQLSDLCPEVPGPGRAGAG